MKMIKRNYLILLILALLFATPGISAYLYYRNPQWLSAQTTNKGELLNPPVLLSDVMTSKQKWRFILWYPEHCDMACLQAVDKLARVRLALGRHLYDVEQWLVLADSEQQKPMALTQQLREQDIHVLRLSKNTVNNYPDFNEKPRIFIANPDGYLILAYAQAINPADIFHDMKQLLNTTEKKSG